MLIHHTISFETLERTLCSPEVVSNVVGAWIVSSID